MKLEALHEGQYLRILWNEESRIIGTDWKEMTSEMTTEEFKANLTLFATQVESKKAPSILVDVTKFRHKVQPEVQPWRIKNISTRYSAAGVRRFAFLSARSADSTKHEQVRGGREISHSRLRDHQQQAVAWLTDKSGHEVA